MNVQNQPKLPKSIHWLRYWVLKTCFIHCHSHGTMVNDTDGAEESLFPTDQSLTDHVVFLIDCKVLKVLANFGHLKRL